MMAFGQDGDAPARTVLVRMALDWLMILDPGYWNGVEFLVRKLAQMRSFLWASTPAVLQDLIWCCTLRMEAT